MKRHPALVSLSKEHYDGLVLAQLSHKNAPVYKHLPNDIPGKIATVLQNFKSKIIPHFEAEENILIPLIKGHDLAIDKIIEIILDDHRKLYSFYETLCEDNSREDILHEFGTLLEKHARREEREWFDLIQEKIPKEILEKIRIALADRSSFFHTKTTNNY